jgi:hypothetical protein
LERQLAGEVGTELVISQAVAALVAVVEAGGAAIIAIGAGVAFVQLIGVAARTPARRRSSLLG